MSRVHDAITVTLYQEYVVAYSLLLFCLNTLLIIKLVVATLPLQIVQLHKNLNKNTFGKLKRGKSYLQFQKSQKANFLYMSSTFGMLLIFHAYCVGFMNRQICYFFIRKHNLSQFGIPVTFEPKELRRLGWL